MTMLHTDIECPNCHVTIHVPFIRALQAKAEEDFDITEISAQEKLSEIKGWLDTVSLAGLIQFWFKRGRQ